MKLPVNIIVDSPVVESMNWFADKTTIEIITSQDKNFKTQLMKNVIQVINKLNRSFHDKVDAWQYLKPYENAFGTFFKATTRMALSEEQEFNLNHENRYQLLTFLNNAFNSIEVDFVRNQIKKFLPLSIWVNLSDTRRELELSQLPADIRAVWKKLEIQDRKLAKAKPDLLEEKMFERKFMFHYVLQFLKILQTAVVDVHEDAMETDSESQKEMELNKEVALYCQRFIEFIIDIESQLPLRRFFHPLLDFTHFIVRCQLSNLARNKSPEGHLFDQLVELLLLYAKYDLNLNGEPLTEAETLRKHEAKIFAFQKVMWSKYQHLKMYAIKPIKAVDNPTALYEIVTSFDTKEELFQFLKELNLVDDSNMDKKDQDDPRLMVSILMNNYKRYNSHMKKINSIPLFPNECVIWDTNLVPDQYYNYEAPLALPKLNLQFLTMSDYLLRNFMLFKNESTYDIRQDLEDGIYRSKCRWTDNGNFATGPKQRMALIIKEFSITEVGKPKLGESHPSKVRAKIVLNMDYVKPEWRREWEQLRKHDTCFLVSFRNPTEKDESGWPTGTFPEKHRIKYVRGCEIEGLLDGEGKVIDENIETPKFTNNLRTFLVWMDCNQYKNDMDNYGEKKMTVYNKFHLIIRRKPEKNNFKGVLETIRSLINTRFVVPVWLRDLLIGFGEPTNAHYSTLKNPYEIITLDYYDTFLDFDHLRQSFETIKPDYSIKIEEEAAKKNIPIQPPFRVEFYDNTKELAVIPYRVPLRGPYPTVMPKKNMIKFTPAQVDAITSGLQKGLTMVVGPPGTGKTDVAVQILSTLYHSYPEQRTLIVTHSNQALNQIFEKMIELDVEEHHLLRLGHGEEDLQSNKDFSRQGRVRYVLTKRLELLIQVGRLARSLDLDPGQGFTCESAEYFQFYHILSRWEEYIESIRGTKEVNYVGDKFPFTKFFNDAPQPLFKRQSIQADFEIAKGCYRYITNIFDRLQSFRPFEIFNSSSDRSKYLMIREAKVIAMTCTHAGLRRKELVEMNFQYDNILMEETAQILEIETTIPLLLQNPEKGVNRLKRWIMIGDHNQLPPIIQNSSFQKFSNMEQSLFARFVRLGVPTIELDAQGRARPSLCDLYRWRYKNLKELDHVTKVDEYIRANAGFAFEYQLIDVGDLNGVGETAPMPHYYQNKAEAEYVVAMYKYMRIRGYPNEKITILTTYNGQRELLREMFDRVGTEDAHIGMPSKVTTVDKYQGQQNDFVLLSLVRTKTVGHVRDIRRLVVAMSRARLGLYVFARVNLFSNCLELQPSMKLFLARPLCLCLFNGATGNLVGEDYPSARLLEEPVPLERMLVVKTLSDMQHLVGQHYSLFVKQQAARAEKEMDCDGDGEEGDGDVDASRDEGQDAS